MATVLVFTEESVEAAADYLSFERASEYLERVENLKVTGTEVTARVYGTHPYRVRLTGRNRQLAGRCSCPYGQEGAFCKHCVATGLIAVRESGGELKLPDSGPGTAAGASDAVETWFARATKAEIIDALRDIADEDPGFRERLELRAAVLTFDTHAVQAAVEELVMTDGDTDYRDARAYAARVEQAADALADLADADPGFAGHAIDFATEAIDTMLDEYAFFEDYSGAVTTAVSSMFDAHLHACQIARPDPEQLAAYLADLIMQDDTGFVPHFDGYVPLLGEAGRAVLLDRAAELRDKDRKNWRARVLEHLAVES